LLLLPRLRRYVCVPATVEIHEREPRLDLAPWDHVTESALSVGSGSVVLMGCTDYKPEAVKFPLLRGDYRVRVLSGGFDTLSDDGWMARIAIACRSGLRHPRPSPSSRRPPSAAVEASRPRLCTRPLLLHFEQSVSPDARRMIRSRRPHPKAQPEGEATAFSFSDKGQTPN
jgi:hypothetical protein